MNPLRHKDYNKFYEILPVQIPILERVSSEFGASLRPHKGLKESVSFFFGYLPVTRIDRQIRFQTFSKSNPGLTLILEWDLLVNRRTKNQS